MTSKVLGIIYVRWKLVCRNQSLTSDLWTMPTAEIEERKVTKNKITITYLDPESVESLKIYLIHFLMSEATQNM